MPDVIFAFLWSRHICGTPFIIFVWLECFYNRTECHPSSRDVHDKQSTDSVNPWNQFSSDGQCSVYPPDINIHSPELSLDPVSPSRPPKDLTHQLFPAGGAPTPVPHFVLVIHLGWAMADHLLPLSSDSHTLPFSRHVQGQHKTLYPWPSFTLTVYPSKRRYQFGLVSVYHPQTRLERKHLKHDL